MDYDSDDDGYNDKIDIFPYMRLKLLTLIVIKLEIMQIMMMIMMDFLI